MGVVGIGVQAGDAVEPVGGVEHEGLVFRWHQGEAVARGQCAAGIPGVGAQHGGVRQFDAFELQLGVVDKAAVEPRLGGAAQVVERVVGVDLVSRRCERDAGQAVAAIVGERARFQAAAQAVENLADVAGLVVVEVVVEQGDAAAPLIRRVSALVRINCSACSRCRSSSLCRVRAYDSRASRVCNT